MRGVIRKGRYYLVKDGRYFIDGKEVPRAELLRFVPEFAEADHRLPRRLKVGVGPKLSDALAVHPTQVEEARQDAIKKGVPTDFVPDGRAVIRSRLHQKAYLKAYGFRNNDAGYSD